MLKRGFIFNIFYHPMQATIYDTVVYFTITYSDHWIID